MKLSVKIMVPQWHETVSWVKAIGGGECADVVYK